MTRKPPNAPQPAARKATPARRGDPFKRLVEAGIKLSTLHTPQAV